MKNTLPAPVLAKANYHTKQKVRSILSTITDIDLYEEEEPVKNVAVKYNRNSKQLVKTKN